MGRSYRCLLKFTDDLDIFTDDSDKFTDDSDLFTDDFFVTMSDDSQISSSDVVDEEVPDSESQGPQTPPPMNMINRPAPYARLSPEKLVVARRIIENGGKWKDLVDSLGIRRTCAFKLIKQVQEGEDLTHSTRGRKPKNRDMLKSHITNILQEDCTLSLTGIATKIKDEWNYEVSDSLVSRTLKAMGWSKKKAQKGSCVVKPVCSDSSEKERTIHAGNQATIRS